MGGAITVARQSNPLTSVSKTGQISENGRRESRFRRETRHSNSRVSATRLLRHLTWELKKLTPLIVTWIGLLSHGAST
jgi:hypothetical protein